MKKILFTISLILVLIQPVYALGCFNNDKRAVKNLLESQVKYANKANFNKFISTYDSSYKNGDGFNLDVYSELVKDIWSSYDKIKYGILIKNIKIDGATAIADLIETSHANLLLPESSFAGELKSVSDSRYYLRKFNGKWKVVSDEVLDETTSMFYGSAKDLDVKLTVPQSVEPNSEYTATLEFVPPKNSVAIASISSDIVEYPQKPPKEVFRAMPEDNILERLFTSNNKNANEYVVASIGITKTDICDLSIKLSLTGFGYTLRRVNVIPEQKENNKNVESK